MSGSISTSVDKRASQEGQAAGTLTLGAMIGWGVGTLGPVTILSATNALLLRYMTDFQGIAAGLAASLIAASKLYDAFADPVMGVVSDRTQTRWGRRRPYLLLGGALLALSLLAIFGGPSLPGPRARSFYMAGALLFYATAYTVYNIPYVAMAAEMTSDYHQRSSLMSWRVYAVGVAQIVATYGGPLVITAFGGGAAAHRAMAWMMVPVVLLASAVCFYATRHAPFHPRQLVHPPLREQFRTALANRPFFVLILIKFVTLMSLGAQAIFPFFFTRILEVSYKQLGAYFLVASLSLIVSARVWLLVSKHLDKRTTYWLALGLSIPVYLSWLLAGNGEPAILIYARATLIGAAGAGALLMGQSLLPDTIEYDYLRTGQRREGVYAGLYTTVEKLSAAAGVALVGALLGYSGYIQSQGGVIAQPATALLAIRLTISVVPALLSLIACLLLLGYHLDERRLGALRLSPATC